MMNISEIHMLGNNLREFYYAMSYPDMYIQIENRGWFLREGKITKYSYLFTPQALSESLFNWVFR